MQSRLRAMSVVLVAASLNATAVPVQSDDDTVDSPVVVQTEATAAEQAVVVQTRGGLRFGAYDVREAVDPLDGVERFVVLLPNRPLIVEATLTMNGEPFRVHREKLIDEMLAAGDRDGDGVVTWDEALRTPGFTYGRVFPDQQRARYIEMLDGDANGQVDRSEARGFLAVAFQGPAFLLTESFANRGRGVTAVRVNRQPSGAAQVNVMAVLDTDRDGVLSEDEIARAGERLQRCDTDGNDLLVPSEFGGSFVLDSRRTRTNQNQQNAPQQSFLLGPTVNQEALYVAFREKYLTSAGRIRSDHFVGRGNPFAPLDADRNGNLNRQEVMRLNEIEPHARFNVDLGRGEGESTLALTYLEDGEKDTDDTDSSVAVRFPGVVVNFAVNTDETRNFDYNVTAQRMLDQYDSDNNEYLELSELPDNFAQRFGAWDSDSDGKVYKQEIVNGYKQAERPQRTQIQVAASRSGDPLFPVLDLSGDSRLSLREMRTAHIQLSALDDNGDGKLLPAEVEVSYDVDFRIGNGGYAPQYRVTAVRAGFQPAAPPRGDGPQWFLRMDRNGDGDVTLREFLGDREAFEALDTNSDGFIEPAEAKAVSEGESEEE